MYLRIIFIVMLTVFLASTSGMSEELDSIDFRIGNSKSVPAKSGNLIVDIKHDLLSIKADDVSIEDIIRKIVMTSGIRGWILDDGQEKITIEFQDIPLQEGLRKILKNKNYGFVYNQNEDGGGALYVINPKKGTFSKPTEVAILSKPEDRVKKYSKKKKLVEETGKSDKKKSPKQDIKDLLERMNVNQLTDAMSKALNNFADDEKSSTGADESSENLTQIFESLSTTTSSDMQGKVIGGQAEQEFVDNVLSNINLDGLNKLLPETSSE